MDTSNLSQYDDETAVERVDEQRFRGRVSSAWNIGGNPNGGYLVSLITRALSEAVDKLRPEGESPSEPLPREWYPYTILHGAYMEDKLNRDIMARLYISEGTFNRTRRSAIRSVRRVLEEMEAALH